jgi:hypothetical protein
MKILFDASSLEIKPESAGERQTLRSLVRLLLNSKLIEGAGVVAEQLPESIIANHQINPHACAAASVK